MCFLECNIEKFVSFGFFDGRYGEQAAKVTNEGLDAAGHAIGTAWAVFKIRKAINPKSVLKPTTLAKAAVEANSAELEAKIKTAKMQNKGEKI